MYLYGDFFFQYIHTVILHPGSLVVKNLPANAGGTGDTGLIPGSGRSPKRGNGTPFQYSCLENPMDRGGWQATVHGNSQVERADYGTSASVDFGICEGALELICSHTPTATWLIDGQLRYRNPNVITRFSEMWFCWGTFWMALSYEET